MRKNLLFLLIGLIISSCVCCFGYTVHKLDNGQTLIIEEIHDNPIVTIDTWIKTGSIDETDANSGVAHFLEHLFFKGTTKYPTGQFDKILESKGAVNNAATSKDFTHYYITIPSAEFDKALELHSDMLLNPQIPRKELEKERKVVIEEISKNNDNPQRKLYKNLNSILYSQHPYAREVIGKKEIIETITREEILKFYEKYYLPSNMITVIVGDVNSEDVKNKVKQYFSSENNKKVIKNIHTNDKQLTKQTEKILHDNITSAYMLVGFRGVNYKNKKDSYALDVLSTILGDGKTSRLYQNIKDKKQLATSISASHSSYKEDSIFYVNATFEPENYESLKKEIFIQTDNLINSKISSDEIEKAKKMIERDTFYSRESGSNIANELGYTTLIWETPKFYSNYIENIKKVNANDLNRVAKKYLQKNKAAISVLLPYNSKTTNNQDKKNYSGQEKLIAQDGNITKYQLENNATLLINQNKLNDIIAIEIYVKGGTYTEKIPGINSIMAAAMMKGTKNYNAYELSKVMEENGIKISPSASSDTFTVGMKTTKNELDLGLNLLNEVLNDATFNPYTIEQVKAEQLALIKQSRDLPSNLMFEEFKTKIWANNPYGKTGKTIEKYIPTISQKNLIDTYKNMFKPQNIVISINGNVDNKKMIEYFSSVFDKNTDSKINIKSYKNQNTPLDKSEDIKINNKNQTAWYVIGWQVNGLDNLKDYATLRLINTILGSGMSSRLFVNLRDEQGLAYQVSSFYTANINHGLFGAYIGTNPANYTKATKDILKEIEKLKKEFVTEKELNEAKDKLLGHYLLSQETNMEKASQLGWFEASERGFQFEKEYPKLIKSVTSSDIINVANKYFNGNHISVTVAPKNELK